MESRAILATIYPCLPANLGVKVGSDTLRLPGFQRRTIGTRLAATGAFERGSVTVERKLSWKLGEGGFGAVAYGEQRRNRRAPILGFAVTTSIIPPFGEEATSSIKSFLGEDHQDGDDEEEEGGENDRKGGGNDDEKDSTNDEEDSSDEEDTTEDEDDEDEGDQEDEGECD